MSLRIHYNSSSERALMGAAQASRRLNLAMEKLSSGLRINRASDDAAGLSISENLRAQLRGRHQARANAQDFISLVQTAEGALGEVTSLLQRVRELAVQAANGTHDAKSRAAVQAEVDQAIAEITSITTNTAFNGKKLLDGTFTNQDAQIGANNNETLSVSINDMRADALGLTPLTVTTATSLSSLGVTAGTVVVNMGPFLPATVNIAPGDTLGTFFANMSAMTGGTITGSVSGNLITLGVSWIVTGPGMGGGTSNFATVTNLTGGAFAPAPFPGTGTFTATAPISGGGGISVASSSSAGQAIVTVDAALSRVSSERSSLGAYQNRLESIIRNLDVGAENMAAADSRLRDADFAELLGVMVRHQILAKSSLAMSMQARQTQQTLLRLLA